MMVERLGIVPTIGTFVGLTLPFTLQRALAEVQHQQGFGSCQLCLRTKSSMSYPG